ncbi:MAG: glutaminyl-peptide cyclotransferase, partial [Candidatus Bathyarchaeota archaeon]|nr:glutaminyl-peptide cyclotransferase [Candidatus Bathyarchaeota archaeon]
MKKQYLAALGFTLIVLAAVTLVLSNNTPEAAEQRNYTYNIVNVYPHDETAFTQGLVFDSGNLYEGTGRNGESTLRRVDLESGNVTQLYSLPSNYFGEGITIFGDKIFQLTWTSHKGFVY